MKVGDRVEVVSERVKIPATGIIVNIPYYTPTTYLIAWDVSEGLIYCGEKEIVLVGPGEVEEFLTHINPLVRALGYEKVCGDSHESR